jgi:cytochrome d ubiquinol oxidase subunit II
LTIHAAAAPRATLVAVSVAVVAGAVILFPSLAVLFRLMIAGELDESSEAKLRKGRRSARRGASLAPSTPRLALACLVGGFGLTTIASGTSAHAVGVVLLFGFTIFGFAAALPPDLLEKR